MLKSFAFIPFIILKNELPQSLQAGIKGLAFIRFRKFLNELLQIGIAGDHKGGNGDVQLAALYSQVNGLIQYFGILPPAVLIVFPVFNDTGGFAVGDHKDLLIAAFASPQQIHGQFQPGYGIGMVRSY